MYDRVIYTPQGIIDEANKNNFQQQLLNLINNTTNKDIFVDFQGVEFVDSSGLVILIDAYNEAKNQQKNFYLFNVSPAVKMLLEISQLDKVLRIIDFNYDDLLVA